MAETAFDGAPSLVGLAAFVQERMAGIRSEHGWKHAERVYHLADWLAQEVGARREIVLPAALLHDVGRREEEKGMDHAEASALVAQEALPRWDYTSGQVEEIRHCILAHRFSTGPCPATLEAQVLSDADKLDALGAVGIARTFLHGGAVGRTLEESLQHFHRKLLRLAERMYTPPAFHLAKARIAYMEDFLQRLAEEQSPPLGTILVPSQTKESSAPSRLHPPPAGGPSRWDGH